MPTSAYDAESFARLARERHAAGSPVETAAQVVHHAREVLESDHAGITMIRRRRRLETVAPSDELVTEADRLQYELDEGPCRDASWHGPTLDSEDLASDTRWPRWSSAVCRLGLRSVLAVELTTREGRIGSLNVYYSDPRCFSADDVAFGSIFGRHAALALASSYEAANLTTALDARKLIGQAQGILMERFQLDGDQAFAVLRRYSQEHNVKLREVAELLVETRALPDRPRA